MNEQQLKARASRFYNQIDKIDPRASYEVQKERQEKTHIDVRKRVK